jgi:hypothetical protein
MTIAAAVVQSRPVAVAVKGGSIVGPKGDPGSPGEGYATRTAMAARAAPALLDDVFLTESGREGKFVVDLASNWTAAIAADTAQGLFVLSTADATKVYRRVYDGSLFPHWFGAKGDGGTDDGAAFAAMSAMLNFQAGGSVALRSGAVYMVGGQTAAFAGLAFGPNTPYIIDINGCTKPVTVHGNGATIRCLAGSKFGSFNADGTVLNPTLPFFTATNAAIPYRVMLRIQNCTAPVTVVGALDLDGNNANFTLGGQWGDTGWQLECVGIQLNNNTGQIEIDSVHSHDHGQDGIERTDTAATEATDAAGVLLRNCDFSHNPRQGLSWVRAWRGHRCRGRRRRHPRRLVHRLRVHRQFELQLQHGRRRTADELQGLQIRRDDDLCVPRLRQALQVRRLPFRR